jgi:hypothetical protein
MRREIPMVRSYSRESGGGLDTGEPCKRLKHSRNSSMKGVKVNALIIARMLYPHISKPT